MCPEVVESTLPLLTIFYQSTKNKSAAIFLEVLTILTGIVCNISAHAWQARVCWTLAGSEALPGSKYLKQIHPRTKLPVNAHFFSTFLVAIIGCIYVGSTTAFNAIITACICLLLISYSIPAILLLRARNKGFAHGPFCCGKLGYITNILTILWTIFCLVFLFVSLCETSYKYQHELCICSLWRRYFSSDYLLVSVWKS